jgi:hypothetical protein
MYKQVCKSTGQIVGIEKYQNLSNYTNG